MRVCVNEIYPKHRSTIHHFHLSPKTTEKRINVLDTTVKGFFRKVKINPHFIRVTLKSEAKTEALSFARAKIVEDVC